MADTVKKLPLTKEMIKWRAEYQITQNTRYSEFNEAGMEVQRLNRDIAEAVIQFGLAIKAMNTLLDEKKVKLESARKRQNESRMDIGFNREFGKDYNDYKWY